MDSAMVPTSTMITKAIAERGLSYQDTLYPQSMVLASFRLRSTGRSNNNSNYEYEYNSCRQSSIFGLRKIQFPDEDPPNPTCTNNDCLMHLQLSSFLLERKGDDFLACPHAGLNMCEVLAPVEWLI